jgi:hypothetical protein
MIFTEWSTVDARRLAQWQAAFDRSGTRIQQSPAYAKALSGAGHRVGLAAGPGMWAVFTRGADGWAAVCNDVPFLSLTPLTPEHLAAVAIHVRRETDLPVYLPLVAGEYAAAAEGPDWLVWTRPPNSLIDWSAQGQDLRERVRDRGGSQPERKARLIHRDRLTIDHGRTGDQAVADVLTVDDRSWKADCGDSMRLRGSQWALYGELLRQGVVSACFLRHGDRPVAFRLDSRVKDRVACLKWSYDMADKRYSPGTYLLTEGLRTRWSGHAIRVIDLCGGPDPLKDLLYSERPARVDLWHGDVETGRARAAERQALDARVAAARDQGRGLRHAFS